MRDFSWNLFTVTGDIEAYLLFKQIQSLTDVKQVFKGVGESGRNCDSDASLWGRE